MTDDPEIFTVRHATTWQDAKHILEEYSQHFVFRGQGDASWELATSLERTTFFAKSYHVEDDFIRDFMRAAGSFPELTNPPLSNDVLSWLSIMQHYGAPTRLLDFTFSPFIAAFFAMENARTDCAIWAISEDRLKEDIFEKMPTEFRKNHPHSDIQPDEFSEIYSQNKIKCIVPVRPSVANKRYMLQQALFLSLGNSNEPFMSQLSTYSWPEYLGDHIHKIVIPREVSDEALWDLNRMNINRATLFGDIEGFSVALRRRYELRHDGAPQKLHSNSLPADRQRQFG